MGTINIAISLTALFSGLFIVGAGDIADKLGRVDIHRLSIKYFGSLFQSCTFNFSLLVHVTKVEPSVDETKTKFDVTGLILLVITLLSVNVMVTQAADRGLFSPMILSLGAVFLVAGILFIIRELKQRTR